MDSHSPHTQDFLVIMVLINLAQIDSQLHHLELSWLQNKLKELDFDPIEKNKLQSEIESPSFGHFDYFKLISNPYQRKQLLNFARTLFNLDGQYHQKEKEAFLKLQNIHEELSINSKDFKYHQYEVAKELVKNSKNLNFYEGLEKFGQDLKTNRPFIHLKSPSLAFVHILSHLLAVSKYTRLLALIIILIIVSYIIFSLIKL